jgi:hypothetical protein
MRIDIIHIRDPDCACDSEVYVDGKPVSDDESIIVELWDFDPGAGYSMDDFEEQKQGAVDNAPDFLKERIAAIYDQMEPTYQKWSYE